MKSNTIFSFFVIFVSVFIAYTGVSIFRIDSINGTMLIGFSLLILLIHIKDGDY